MSICNCEHCGKVILANYEKRCKACSELLLMQRRKVKEFIRAHPQATLLDVYHETGVSLQTIKDLLES